MYVGVDLSAFRATSSWTFEMAFKDGDLASKQWFWQKIVNSRLFLASDSDFKKFWLEQDFFYKAQIICANHFSFFESCSPSDKIFIIKSLQDKKEYRQAEHLITLLSNKFKEEGNRQLKDTQKELINKPVHTSKVKPEQIHSGQTALVFGASTAFSYNDSMRNNFLNNQVTSETDSLLDKIRINAHVAIFYELLLGPASVLGVNSY